MKTFLQWLEANGDLPDEPTHEVLPTTYTPRKRNMAPWALPDWVPDWAREQEVEQDPLVQQYRQNLAGTGLTGPAQANKTQVQPQAKSTQSANPRLGGGENWYPLGGRADQGRSRVDDIMNDFRRRRKS